MALTGTADLFARVGFVLVTCSRDHEREVLAMRTVQNLAEQLASVSQEHQLITFDNDSVFKGHLSFLPIASQLCQCDRNIGYWAAIDWLLNNTDSPLNKGLDYIYIIESDLIHYDIHRLADCVDFLDRHPDHGCVRTQEYSVRWRWRYHKKNHRLPFYKARSAVAAYNGATREPIRFGSYDQETGIYESTFHAKLPALNRLKAMQKIFQKLKATEEVNEHQFMLLHHELYQKTGVLDGGIFYSMANDPKQNKTAGSYISEKETKKIGYFSTRERGQFPKDFSVHTNQIDCHESV